MIFSGVVMLVSIKPSMASLAICADSARSGLRKLLRMVIASHTLTNKAHTSVIVNAITLRIGDWCLVALSQSSRNCLFSWGESSTPLTLSTTLRAVSATPENPSSAFNAANIKQPLSNCAAVY